MRRISGVGAGLAVAAGMVALVACSSSGGGTSRSSAPARGVSTPAPTTSAASSTPAPSTTSSAVRAVARPALTGTWSGHYSGTFTGTFTLTWHEAGANLSGTIRISSLNNQPDTINGTVQGGHIRFGTVGSQAIQYAGTVSGGSMSGSWTIGANGKSAGGGSWSAAKA